MLVGGWTGQVLGAFRRWAIKFWATSADRPESTDEGRLEDILPKNLWFASEKCPKFASVSYWLTSSGRLGISSQKSYAP
jgi:hypothetical protein